MKEYGKQQQQARRKADRRRHRRMRKVRRYAKQTGQSLLEEVAMKGAESHIQDVLEEERESFLERKRYERASDEEFKGYRNGYSKPRRLTLGCGQVEVQMPRVRDNAERFRSGLVGRYQRTGKNLLDALPELYLHGISLGDFQEALQTLLGTGAGLSAASIARLKRKWHADYMAFSTAPLESHYAYVWADGIYLRVGGAGDKLALLVVVGTDAEGRKRLLALIPGERESYAQWLDVFRDLAERGVTWIGLMIADGIPGLWRAVGEAFPDALCQRDWMHKKRNVLDKLPKRNQKQAKEDLDRIYYAETKEEATKWMVYFADQYRAHPAAVECLLKNQQELLAYYAFPKEHWRHLRTSNPIESPFAVVRSRLRRAKRIVQHWSALGLVHQLLLLRQRRWHRLNAPELVAEVIAGAKYRNGIKVKEAQRNA